MKRLTIFLLFVLLVACAPGTEPQADAPQDAVSESVQSENADSEVATADQSIPESAAPRVTEEQATDAELPVAQEEPPVMAEAIEEPGAESAPPGSEPQELPAPAEETADSPTEEPPIAEAPEVTGPVIVSGRTEEGAFFLGDVNAPVTLIDYSDFL
jgi:hypothetical protein